MKRSHSETFPGLTIPVPLSNEGGGGGGDQYLYIILKYTFGKYRYSFHRIRVSDLMVSSSSKRSHSHGHEKPQKLPKPILKLPSDRYPIFMGFFSAWSKIYMFGGEELCTGLACRNCYVFNTCQKNNPSKVVKEGPPMVFGKYHPVVLGPLHGKFYVLDSTLASNHLEEFDPQTETWTPLPSAPIAPPKEEEDDCSFFLFTTIAKKYKVVSQAIVGDRILLSTQEKGIYVFHVISHTWEHWSSLDRRGNARLPYSSGSEFHRGFWYAFPDRRYAAPHTTSHTTLRPTILMRTTDYSGHTVLMELGVRLGLWIVGPTRELCQWGTERYSSFVLVMLTVIVPLITSLLTCASLPDSKSRMGESLKIPRFRNNTLQLLLTRCLVYLSLLLPALSWLPLSLDAARIV